MLRKKHQTPVYIAAILLIVTGFTAGGAARAMSPQAKRARSPQPPPAPVYSTGLPDDVQLVNGDVNPSIRIPVSHSSLNWTLLKPRIKASYGWLDIDRDGVHYNMARSSRVTREADQGFAVSRTDIIDLKMEYGAAEFRASGLRHFFGYSPQSHWDALDAGGASASSVSKADGVSTPLILQALQGFDSVVAQLKVRQQAAAPPPVPVRPVSPPAPQPVSAPPAPTLVIMTPSGASENQTIEVNDSGLTIRGVAMDDAGLPTVTINGAPAALRPKNQNVAEFWSDPTSLKPGENHFDIVATSPAKATSHFKFTARFTPKAAPVNPRALGKEEIISLLQGGVPDAHVIELVKDRGIKFTPAPADLNDICAAGGSEDLVQAIKQVAPGK